MLLFKPLWCYFFKCYVCIITADNIPINQIICSQLVFSFSGVAMPSVDTESHSVVTSTTDSNAKTTTIPQQMSRRQRHIRSLRTLGAVMITFLVCWLPFCLFWPIAAYCPDCISLPAYEYSYWSAYLNSTVNPLIYFISNKDFRHAFRNLLRIK